MKRTHHYGTNQLPKSQHHTSGERNMQLGQINGYRNLLGLQGTSIQGLNSNLGPDYRVRDTQNEKQFQRNSRIAVGNYGVRVRVGNETIDAGDKSKNSILSEGRGNTLVDKNQHTLRQKTAIEKSEDASASQATYEESDALGPKIQEVKRKLLSQETNYAMPYLPLQSNHARTYLQQESSNNETEFIKTNPASRPESNHAFDNGQQEQVHRPVLGDLTRELLKIEESASSTLHISRQDDDLATIRSKSSKMVPILLSSQQPQISILKNQIG